jgi:acyl carrier protein
MTPAPDGDLRAVVLRRLRRVAPGTDLAALDPDADLREALDLDSMDFLAFVVGLHEDLGVDIPEADNAKVATLRSCLAYLAAKLPVDRRPPRAGGPAA